MLLGKQISKEHIDYMLSKIPRKRFVLIDELASMVSWLATEENSFTTGAIFDISAVVQHINIKYKCLS